MTMTGMRTGAAAAAFAAVTLALTGRPVDAGPAAAGSPRKDAPPVVTFITPRNGSLHGWDSWVNYQVVVSYRGKSTRYREIPAKRVLLRVAYVPDLSAARKPAVAAVPVPTGLLDIVDSNCLGCHDFKGKAMGPSFAAIAAHYPDSRTTVDRLARHIRKGFTGVWGQESMPPHPQLTRGQAHAIALWIMKAAADPGVSYHVGTEGAIRMRAPGTPGAHAGLVLTASYTSPATAAGSRRAAYGAATVALRGK